MKSWQRFDDKIDHEYFRETTLPITITMKTRRKKMLIKLFLTKQVLYMAYAVSPVASTKETTNYARLCRLPVDIGTQALRDTFNAIHAPANLFSVLSANKGTLQPLRNKKIINPIQWGKLSPAIQTAVSSRDFDATLLMVLLRNICGLIPPPTGWDALPAATDLSREADLARIKHYRNTIYGHAEKASVDDTIFNDCWRDIRVTLVRLGGATYAAAVDNLKNECMDPQVQDHYKELLSQWKKDEDNVKEQLHEIMKKLDVLTISKEKTGDSPASIKATIRRSMCKEPYHENEPLQYYCKECNVCICHKCRQTRHNQHTKVDIPGAATDKKVQWRKIVDRAKADVDFLEAKIKEQGRLMEESEEEVVAAQKVVTETVESIIGRLREHEAEMITKLTKINETQQSEHTARLVDLKLCAEQLNASIKYDEDVLHKSDCLEILQADNAAFSLREDNLNIQEIKLYRSRHVNYVLDQRSLIVSRPLVLGKVVASHTDPSVSMAQGQGLMEAELGVETNFKVTTRDSQGNQFYDEEDQLVVKICAPDGENENDNIKNIEDCKDGSYTVRYKPKGLGSHDVRIEVNGQPLTGSPWRIKVNPHRYKYTWSLTLGTRGAVSIALNERTGQMAVADSAGCIEFFEIGTDKSSRQRHLTTIGDGNHRLKIECPMSVAFLRNDDLIITHEKASHTPQMSVRKMLVFDAHDQSIRVFSKHVIQPYTAFVKSEGDGQVVVSDEGDNTIKVLSPDGGVLLQSFSPPECNESPDFVFHKHSTFFASYQHMHRVKAFSDEGVFLYDIGSFGSSDGQLNRPIGLAVDAFNRLIVCDRGNRRVQVFTLNGKFLYSIPKGTIDDIKPWFVTVSDNGEVLISNTAENSDCIYCFE